jgi:hypothetical protein
MSKGVFSDSISRKYLAERVLVSKVKEDIGDIVIFKVCKSLSCLTHGLIAEIPARWD